jgi:hypothetical protein
MKPVAAKPNLRNQQRVDVATEARIEKTDGSCLTCKVSNISRTGLMVLCDQDSVRKLVPGQKIAGGNSVHMRRIARDQFQLGIQFSEFEGNGFDYVNNYVSKLLSTSSH